MATVVNNGNDSHRFVCVMMTVGGRSNRHLRVVVNIEPPTPQHTMIGFKGSKLASTSAVPMNLAASHLGKM